MMLALLLTVTVVGAASAGRLDQLAYSQSSAYSSASASASASSSASSFSRNGVLATPFRYENHVNNGDGNYRFSTITVTVVGAASAGRLDQLTYSQSSAYSSNSASASASSSVTSFNNGDGNYRFSYDANGISAHESGSPRAPGPEGPAVTSEGGYSYRAPDGQQISLTYTADENGFHPVGSHLPTPPPIPDAILRSLEYNRQHPSNDDGSYNPGRAGYQY